MSTKTKIAAIVVIIMVALLYNAKAQTKILTQKNTKQMQGLKTQMATLETKITDFDKKNTTVSQATVGWQIEHILLVVNSVLDTTLKSNPDEYKYKFKLIRSVVMTTGKIPRGKGKAPDRVVPRATYTADELQNHLNTTIEKLQIIEKIQPNQHFTHPFFGQLNKKPMLKFLKIHTNHHLHIINDILK